MLNNIGLPGLLLIAVVVLVLFGRGKISSLMGEVGKGITSFKKGISEGENETTEPSPSSASDEEAKAEELRETLKATEKEVSSPSGGPARFGDVDLKGGKYGFGERIDDALDATTNPDAFLIGGFALVIGAAILFALGPRPPSDYYGY